MAEKSTTTEKSALPEIGYYTDENGYAWQLTAEQAAKLGYTAPDEQKRTPAKKPAGPPPDGEAPPTA